MCYFCGTKQMFIDMLNIKDGKEFDLVKRTIDSEYIIHGYCIDEIFMRDKIRNWKYFPGRITFHERSYENTRFDRGDFNIKWKKNMSENWNEIIDIHLPLLPNNTIQYWVEKKI